VYVGPTRVTVAPYPGAAGYIIEAATAAVYTSNVAAPIELSIYSNALSSDGTLHLLVTALANEGTPLAYTWLRDLVFTEPLDVTIPAWIDTGSAKVHATDPPEGTVGAVLQLGYQVRDLLFRGEVSGTVLAPGQEATLAVRFAPGFGDRLSMQLGAYFGDSVEEIDGVSQIVERREMLPAWRELDLGAALLPRVSAPVLDAADPARPSMSWSTAPGRDADGILLGFRWEEAGSTLETWSVLAPPDQPAPVRLPALPGELVTWSPGAATAFRSGRVDLIDAGWLTGYDGLRVAPALDLAAGRAGAFPDGDMSLLLSRGGLSDW
jgi:hypothetical protein